MRRAVVAVGVAVVLLGALTGCEQQESQIARVAKAREAAHEHYLTLKPAGYTDVGEGVAYRWLDDRCADGATRCRVIGLFAYAHCESIYFEGELLDRRGRDLAGEGSGDLTGVVSGDLKTMEPGTTTTAEVSWHSPTARSIRLTSLECL